MKTFWKRIVSIAKGIYEVTPLTLVRDLADVDNDGSITMKDFRAVDWLKFGVSVAAFGTLLYFGVIDVEQLVALLTGSSAE